MLILYLDMDGTLVDFVSQVRKYSFWRKDEDNKVDWDKVKAVGPRFWIEMDWMPGAKAAFETLQKHAAQGLFELFILSSIDFHEGREGKKQWIKTHTNVPLKNVILVQEPEYKAIYADSNRILIDDRKNSLEPFKKAGGNTIEFTGNWTEVMGELERFLVIYEEKRKRIIAMEELVETDLVMYGKTDRVCPFCGTKLMMEGTLVSHAIICENKGCFKYAVRGL